jgi:hypothetical protein
MSTVYFKIHINLESCPATCQAGDKGDKRYSSYSFVTSGLDEDEWSASLPGRALPTGKNPGTHCTGGWVGLRAGLENINTVCES